MYNNDVFHKIYICYTSFKITDSRQTYAYYKTYFV